MVCLQQVIDHLTLQIVTIKIEAGPRGGSRPVSITIGSLKTYDFKTSVDVV